MTNALSTLVRPAAELTELLGYRETIAAAVDMTPAEQTETLKAIDGQIQDYVAGMPGHVGLIRAECDNYATAERAIAKHYMERAKAWEMRAKLLDQVVIQMMNAAGLKKIEGPGASLAIRPNPPSVEVTQPDLLPSQYTRINITMTHALWNKLRSALLNEKTAPIFQELMACEQSPGEPIKAAIAAELKQKCAKCSGQGKYLAGLMAGDGPDATVQCDACGGSGKRGVPGCRLIDDRVRLEVK